MRNLPPLTQWLQGVRAEAERRGYSLFAVVEHSSHPAGGASVTVARGEASAVRAARASHEAWERANGHDPSLSNS